MLNIQVVRCFYTMQFTVGCLYVDSAPLCMTAERVAIPQNKMYLKPHAVDEGTYPIGLKYEELLGMTCMVACVDNNGKTYPIQFANDIKQLDYSIAVANEINIKTGAIHWSSDAWMELFTKCREAQQAKITFTSVASARDRHYERMEIYTG